jgi:hypothetical protein
MGDTDRPTIPEGVLPSADLVSQETKPPPLDAVPWLMLSHADVLNLGLDHQEGFLLSLIDGRTTVGSLIDVAAMPRHRVLVILARWAAMGIIHMQQHALSTAR